MTTPVPEPEAPPQATVPQRAVLVLASSALHDARAYRIATTLAARGHEVTLIARLEPGIPGREARRDGVTVLRVPVSAVDGLPLPRTLRVPLARRWARRRARDFARAGPMPRAASIPPAVSLPASRSARGSGRLRRGFGGLLRIAAVVLSVRAQRRAARTVAPPADVVVGMGFLGLPVALGFQAARMPPVVYDAGDIYVDAGNIARLPGPIRRAFAWLEGRWARGAALVTTANDGYAAEIARRYGVERPLVLLNCPPLPAGDVRRDASPLRAAAGIPAERRIVLYHGGFSPGRGIEQLLAAIRGIPDATLVLLGYGVLEAVVRAAAASDPGRVAVLPAVPQDELLAWIAGADVAAMPIQPTTLNHRLTVPNKLFEAMAAGVPVVASDLPGMAPVVRATGCGLLVDPTDGPALVAALRRVLEAPAEESAVWSDAGRRAVRERYSWEREVPAFLDALGRLTGRPW